MNNFEIGDVVALKSGSLPLTVTSEKNGILELSFFNLQGDLAKASIPSECVEYTEKRWTIMDIDADVDDENDEY